MPETSQSQHPTLGTDFLPQFDDLQMTLAEPSDVLGAAHGSVESLPAACPSHAGQDTSLCQGLMGEWELPPATNNNELYTGIEDPDYSKFENWIPRFVRPEKPCDYCRSKRLSCYLRRGQTSCTPCQSLFRECSLTNSQTLECNNYLNKPRGTFLDTLSAVDENALQNQGALTGIRPLLSKGGIHSGTSTPARDDDAQGSSKRNGIRFPRHAVKILRDWLDTHQDHPYPTEEEKTQLERRTELKPSQIANWLANARRRRKVTEKSRLKPCMSPSLRPSTPALPIPGAAEKPWEELNPFERWQHSPPENEPASITDIAHAVAYSELPDGTTSTSPSSAGRRKRSSNGSGFSNFHAASTTSLETSAARSSSLSTTSAAFSQSSAQSHGSFGSFTSSLAGKRDRRRRRRPTQAASRKPSDDKKRIYQCTFCTDTFKSKYDWTRHEKSLHLSLEKWICHPLGPLVVDQTTDKKKCVYCEVQEPSEDHTETHNHRQCEDKGLDARTFYRKDHLRQHLRLMHGCEMSSFMESWKSTAVNINSRCGFCAQRFTVWQERIDHLNAHFKAGIRMSAWKGCRGLDPAVAAQVTNAMPPYLIGIESVSPNPFSATNRATWRELPAGPGEGAEGDGLEMPSDLGGRHSGPTIDNMGFGSKATCWEILTVRLGKYANEMVHKGIILTDEMLQQQARRILYDSDDTWNQTAADNPEWLDLFKKAQGLDFIPNAIGGEGLQVPEDLETYGDLGLRIPFAIQLQAYNTTQGVGQATSNSQPPGVYKEALAHRVGHFRDLYALLDQQGKLHDENFACGHGECKHNKADVSWLDGGDASCQLSKRWCNYEIATELVKPLTIITKQSSNRIAQSTVQGRGLGSLSECASELCTQKGAAGQRSSLFAGGDAVETAVARTKALNRLAQQEAKNCTDPKCLDNRTSGASSRARSLEVLMRMETPIVDSAAGQKNYLQRHKMQLPPEKAQRFATTTGPWVDSGIMPDVTQTRLSTQGCEVDHTTTGAMMEFLGGEIGGNLPFSSHAATSAISAPLPDDYSWMAAEGIPFPDDGLLMQDLDDMIAATTEPIAPVSSVAPSMTWNNEPMMTDTIETPGGYAVPQMPASTLAPAVPLEDLTMDDFDFDFDEMTFDSAFDMPLDDPFMPQGEIQ